jgi:hypothetical protein
MGSLSNWILMSCTAGSKGLLAAGQAALKLSTGSTCAVPVFTDGVWPKRFPVSNSSRGKRLHRRNEV